MKTKTKLLAVVFSLLMVVFCLAALSACDDETSAPCSHQWSAWATKEAATCTKTGVQERTCASCGTAETKSTAKLAHTPAADDGDCTTAILCKSCGTVVTQAKVKHVGGTAVCGEQMKCSVCGKAYGKPLEHTPVEDDGDCTTEVSCMHCGLVMIPANATHTGGTATCGERAQCAICGKEYGDLLEHTPAADDGDCTTEICCLVCGEVMTLAKEAHTGGTATCTQKATCAVCGKVYGDFAPHTPAEDDGDCTTAILCTVCGQIAVDADASHKGGTATCTQKAKCAICGEEYGDFADHAPASDDGDCTTEVSCTVCGLVVIPANKSHTGGTATCTEKAKCAVCGKEYGDVAAHVPAPDDGDCTTALLCRGCGKVLADARASHTGGTATCNQQARCAVCGKAYGTIAGHTPAIDDGDCTTEVLCTGCGLVMIPANATHTGGTAACGERARCAVCGKAYGELLEHTLSADDGDCTTAVVCLRCGVVVTPANESHTGGSASCDSYARCAVCGKEYGEFAPHSGEEIWVKRLDSHYCVRSCCNEQITQPEAHNIVRGVCTVCGFRPAVGAPSVEAAPGETEIQIAISVTDNPGIAGLMITVEYNTDVLHLTGAESGSAMSALTFTAPSTLGNGCTFLWDSEWVADSDIKNGEILILTFNVLPNAVECEFPISLKINAYDNDLNRFTLAVEDCMVTIRNI